MSRHVRPTNHAALFSEEPKEEGEGKNREYHGIAGWLHYALLCVGLFVGAASVGVLLGDPESRVPVVLGLSIGAFGAVGGAALASGVLLYRRFHRLAQPEILA